MATLISNEEKPVVIYTHSYNLVKYIALNGNYQDILNTMVLLCRYAKVFTTGQVPPVKFIRGGKEVSAVAGLESTLIGRNSQTNALQDFNNMRDNFYRFCAIKHPNLFLDLKGLDNLIGRTCVEPLNIIGEVYIFDCQGTPIGTVTTIADYITMWNTQKVPADYAICNVITPYYFDTNFKSGANTMLGISWVNPDNDTIAFNAPSPSRHRQLDEFKKNRKAIVDEESRVNPKSISTNSNSTL